MRSDFDRKWKSGWQPSGCGSRQRRRRCCASTATCCRARVDRRKPATFTFLGFTHFLTKTRRGTINIGRTPSIKARERFLRRQADWLRANRHLDVRQQQAHLRLALNGYYQYFGVRLAEQALYSVYRRIRKLWRQQLRRRSQRARRTCAWDVLYAKPWFQLPRPRITQLWV